MTSTASVVALHHEIRGDRAAPPLLLGGSLGTNLAMWDPQIAALSRRLRVVGFDHRGHGRSPVPAGPYAIADLGRDVLALMDALQLERASYCGLSIGGMVGIWLAANAPDRIDRLVLICTSAHVPPAVRWQERADAVRAAGSVCVVADVVLPRWTTAAWRQRNPAASAALRAMLVSTPATGYAACCEAIAAMDQRSALDGIAAPTLVIHGREDAAIPFEHGEALAAGIPRARLAAVSPMAHLGNVEQPAEVARLILDHLECSKETR
jgi:3-oxoadipate enol-lactonase